MSRIDEVTKAGTAEVWEVENGSGTAHNFHPHGVSFRVLDYAGGKPPSHLRGVKDTVYVPPNKSVRDVELRPLVERPDESGGDQQAA